MGGCLSITYTKLFSSITESTIWVEPYATRIVWVSMLAMADRKGRVWASIPGLARRAGVTLEEGEAALERFQQPDKYSRTPDNEGRRIEPIDGGWRLLNYDKYRAQLDEESRKEYKRDWDRNKRVRSDREKSESDNIRQNRPPPTQAEAEAVKPKPPAKRSSDSSTTSATLPTAALSPTAKPFPPPDDALVLQMHGLAIASRVRASVMDAQQWAADGLTEAHLRAAIDRAKAKKPPGDVIPIAFLQCMVRDVLGGQVGGMRTEDVIQQAIANIAAKESHAAH
jgi:hypothetical protein